MRRAIPAQALTRRQRHSHAPRTGRCAAVWIWMGMRSDSRCGRDYGTEYVKDTTCGKGSCCSSHGWCGTTEEYCSVALGCQARASAESPRAPT